MTISYSTGFFHLIFRWYGSIWRSIYKELIVYLVLFFSVRLSYTLVIPWIDPDEELMFKVRFEAICRQFNEYTKLIPLTFLLGFYVSNVVSRWWRQFECLNWPEDLLSLLCIAVKGTDERSAQVRHRVARYINVTYALAWRDISDKIRSIFPSTRDIVVAGLLTENEYRLLKELNDQEGCSYTRWMTPLHWVQQIMEEEVSKHGMTVTYLTNFASELKNFRTSFRRLFCHDWVCVPLVYTQVAAIATYGFFFFALFGRQHIGGGDVDTIFPIFTVVQFLFFVGWYKVGLDLMRPFGLDDDDIELSYILERNINVSFAIVNKLQMSEPPPFEADKYYNTGLLFEVNDDRRMKMKKRPPKLNTYKKLFDLEKQKNNNGEEKGDEKMGSFMDVAERVIKEERRSRVREGLNRWLPTWKEEKTKEHKTFYW
ncbi:hypothetical protein PENTCL1PPCAC_18795 [Pristionchus entomophagus]|uniref:Bestrophin homolog n=1 Tax=Pristionchus entomophagus TaxID=358040 RepID=A0AAV5TQB5_9BILA|nr:hypothetical protein PENTCL1PPCAC_18795 [Pristionchus entomophagus]